MAFEHQPVVVGDAPVLEFDDAGVVSIRWARRDDLGERIDRVAVMDGTTKPQAVASQLGEARCRPCPGSPTRIRVIP